MTAPVPDHAALPVEQIRVSPPARLDPIDFWTCDDDAEQLSTTDLEEAAVEYVDGFLSPGCDTETILRAMAPLDVYGYSRAKATDERLQIEAEHVVDRLVEALEDTEEWGDPNGRHRVLSAEGQRLLAEKFAAALREVRAHIVPWHCEVTKTVVLEADELVALSRRLCPEWFEAEVSNG